MKKLVLRMSKDEVRAVLSLADEQIFRLKFIDRKVPGYKYDAPRFESAVSGVEILRHALKGDQSQPIGFANYNTLAATDH
jgi:hypothetical protein